MPQPQWIDDYVIGNGVRSHYYRTGTGDKPAILMLHGMTDNALCWTRMAEDLEDSYDLILTDARGHGRSEGGASDFAISVLADDAARVIEALKLERPYVFGHSMGAVTSMSLAARYPQLVRAVILEDPPIGEAVQPMTPERVDSIREDWQQQKIIPREQRLATTATQNPHWHETEIVPQVDAKVQVDQDILKGMTTYENYRWREDLSRIEHPVLLLTGEPALFGFISPELAADIARQWPQVEVAHIAGAGHCVHRDCYDESMSAIRDFLSRH